MLRAAGPVSWQISDTPNCTKSGEHETLPCSLYDANRSFATVVSRAFGTRVFVHDRDQLESRSKGIKRR
jgi:hypothetical protein